MAKLAALAVKGVLKLAYAFCKLFPVKNNKVLFLSRQTNSLPLDFSLLIDELKARQGDIRPVVILNRVEGGLKGWLKFGRATMRSLYHLATVKTAVLDSYWPAVSVLKHKKSLTVIQIWHAMGKIKQSGYQTLGKEGGRDDALARIMGMHKNYDIIIAGGKAWNPFYCASFGVEEARLRNIGLPRIDHMIATEEAAKKKVLAMYPELKEKPVILYAPTFRRYEVDGMDKLMAAIDTDKYNLVLKAHPNQSITPPNGVFTCPELTSLEVLAACDYLITDYSAIAVEGAVLNKKTLYYLFDYEKYRETNGMNIDLFKEMPTCAFKDAHELAASLEKGYDEAALAGYRQRFLPEELGVSTQKIADIIFAALISKQKALEEGIL